MLKYTHFTFELKIKTRSKYVFSHAKNLQFSIEIYVVFLGAYVNNSRNVIEALGIKPEEVVFNNPFFQRATNRQLGCQVDFLIQTRFSCVYICEIKFQRFEVGPEIISELQEKIERLKLPRHFSYRPVLIHVNGVREDVVDSEFFSNILDFSRLFSMKIHV